MELLPCKYINPFELYTPKLEHAYFRLSLRDRVHPYPPKENINLKNQKGKIPKTKTEPRDEASKFKPSPALTKVRLSEQKNVYTNENQLKLF